MNDASGAKQQIVEKIKSSSTILVTVSHSPSVDELTAALGLTLMLNSIKKHATAVVSGDMPPAIEFLQPGKTFENTVDSLRDFIIALDKEKADHLRYKVDGDVVKIFITPYRTTISQDDLEFSQGDYNVELVLALGVASQDDLDEALKAHGRILHDAVVATLSCGDKKTSLGGIDWFEAGASSISEMLVSLSEALKTDKPLLSEQVATALLTGIVAATDRFSNKKTSSKVMTMAAQLMAAGANQQLIAVKLEEAHEISGGDEDDENADGSTDLSEDKPSKVEKKSSKNAAKSPKESDTTPTGEGAQPDGTLAISHEMAGTLDEVARQTADEQTDAAAQKAEEMLNQQLTQAVPATQASSLSVNDLKKDLEAASNEVTESAAQLSSQTAASSATNEPSFGGTLNATAEQAAEDKQREEALDRNKTILTHGQGTLTDQPAAPIFAAPPINGAESTGVSLPSLADSSTTTPPVSTLPPLPPLATDSSETLADLDAANRNQADNARAAVDAALANAPAQTLSPSASIDSTASLPPLPSASATAPATPPPAGLPLPDFSTLPPPPPPVFNSSVPGAASFDALPPLPEQPLGTAFPDAATPAQPQGPIDPTQFKIPGQN